MLLGGTIKKITGEKEVTNKKLQIRNESYKIPFSPTVKTMCLDTCNHSNEKCLIISNRSGIRVLKHFFITDIYV